MTKKTISALQNRWMAGLAGGVICAGQWEGTAVFCCGFYTDTDTHTHTIRAPEQTKCWFERKWTDVTLIDLGIRALDCLPILVCLFCLCFSKITPNIQYLLFFFFPFPLFFLFFLFNIPPIHACSSLSQSE